MHIPNIHDLNFKDLNELFYRGRLVEDQTLEIKRQLSTDKQGKPDNKEFAKDVTGMVNAEGGTIILGIDEKAQEICGIPPVLGNQKIEDWVSNVLNDLVDKTVIYQIHHIPLNECDDLQVTLLQVGKGTDKPYYVTADKKCLAYIRKGSSVFAAKPSDIAAMYREASSSVEPAGTSIRQQARGGHVQQIGQNFGNIFNTEQVRHVTEVIYDKDDHITDQQAKQIKDKVDEIVDIHEKAGKFKDASAKGRFYGSTWNGIKNRFSVTKYTLLPKQEFDACMDWLQAQIASKHRPVLRRNNNPAWKKEMYGSIYARSGNERQMTKPELYEFAFQKLKLKKPIGSLKDLSDVNLKKLYGLLFST